MTNKEKFIERIFKEVCDNTKVYRYNHNPPYNCYLIEDGSRIAKFDPLNGFRKHLETKYGLFDMDTLLLYKRYVEWVRNRKRSIAYTDGSDNLKEYISSIFNEGR